MLNTYIFIARNKLGIFLDLIKSQNGGDVIYEHPLRH